jgi:hypothetical protein
MSWDIHLLDGIEMDRARAEIAQKVLPGGVYISNFLQLMHSPYDLVIGNPPYSNSLEFVKRGLLWRRYGAPLVMLLRLNWLSSKERLQFHTEHPAHVHVLTRRPSFCVSVKCKVSACGWQRSYEPETETETHNVCQACGSKVSKTSTDATEYAWFQWGGPGYVPGKWEPLEPLAGT